MVKIETRYRIPIWRMFVQIEWHVIPEPPATLQPTGEFNVMIPELCVTLQCIDTGEFSGMSSQSHVSHCRVLPLGEFTVMIPEPHATLQGVIISSAILKIVFRHISFYFCFLNAVWALTSGGFRIVSDLLVTCISKKCKICIVTCFWLFDLQ